MELEVIGPHPLATTAGGKPVTRIGTLFPGHRVLYTLSPPVHACQRQDFVELVNTRRGEKGLPPLGPEEEARLSAESVDLVFETDHILIRPDPCRMDLAFLADDLLQTLVPKQQVKFLYVSDPQVRDAIKRRGECWRLSAIPKDREGKWKLISSSKVAIEGQPIYYYNRLTGTRWLTYQEFKALGGLSDRDLLQHLLEIATFAGAPGRHGRSALDFFGTDFGHLDAADFAGAFRAGMPPRELREKYEGLRKRFQAATPKSLQTDDFDNRAWCDRILSTLFLEGNESATEQILSGLSPEFFLQIEWLPGGRVENGAFIFDSIYEEAEKHPRDTDLQKLCDARARSLIFDFIRVHGDLEYLNVGRVPEPLAIEHPQKLGRRAFYIAELKLRSEKEPIKCLLRLLKWGVWEHLDENKSLERAVWESDDYVDYWSERRLGCRQLGMNLSARVNMRWLSETYTGQNGYYYGRRIRTPYYERAYLPGTASDKIPRESYERGGYAVKLAGLLGKAAATNLIVGRMLEDGSRAKFDDGDEMIREGEDGLPVELLAGGHAGAFADFERPLVDLAPDYALPVNRRRDDGLLRDPRAFAEVYLAAFRDRFEQVKDDYLRHREAFDSLFKNCRYDPEGSFAHRWMCVLGRLTRTNVDELVPVIREHITAREGRPGDVAG